MSWSNSEHDWIQVQKCLSLSVKISHCRQWKISCKSPKVQSKFVSKLFLHWSNLKTMLNEHIINVFLVRIHSLSFLKLSIFCCLTLILYQFLTRDVVLNLENYSAQNAYYLTLILVGTIFLSTKLYAFALIFFSICMSV